MNGIVLNEKANLILAENDRFNHILLTGMAGTGVSYFLTDLILQDVRSNQAAILVDPYGDLANRMLQIVPEQFLSNIVYVDLGSMDYPVGLNIFSAKNDLQRRQVVNAVIELMHNLYDPQNTGIVGPRFDHAVRNALLTIFVEDNPTFIELFRCFLDKEYVERILPKVTDQAVKGYWIKHIAQTSDSQKSEIIDYILSKMSPFVEDKFIRAIANQIGGGLDLERFIKENKTIIFDFGAFYHDKETTKIVSALLFNVLMNNFRQRENGMHNPVSVYIDEVQKWDASAIIELLMYGKRYGVASTFVTSRIMQTDTRLRYELLRSGTVVSFRLNGLDEEVLLPALEDPKSKEDIALKMLRKHHAYVRTLQNGDPVGTQEIDTTREMGKLPEREIEKIKQMNRETNGVPLVKVEEEIAKRMNFS